MFEVVNKTFEEVIQVFTLEENAEKYCFFVDTEDNPHYVRDQKESN